MSKQGFNVWVRRTLLLLGLALGLAQVGCAQPIMMQPSVAISSQMGQVPIYAQVGMPAPMVVMPPPRVVYVPPPQAYGPPVYSVAPAWAGWGYGHHDGHERWGSRGYGGRGREHGWR